MNDVNFNTEYVVEEYLRDGHEFTAVCSKNGLVGIIASIDPSKTVFECIKDQIPYGLEYLNTEQTRDVFPGVESFAIQCMKTLFHQPICALVFIRGFYQSHSNIYFIGASLEPRSKTMCKLMQQSHKPFSWESIQLTNVLHTMDLKIDLRDSFSEHSSNYNMVINFPTSEGILLHQTSIRKRNAMIRVAWRVSEGEEIFDSDSVDDNILQVFMSHTNRDELLSELNDVMTMTDIAVDRLCLIDKHNVCRRVQHRLACRTNGAQLVRSCTTVD
ncbi:hypothetical protein AB6A40_007180 [Gnathostoma spinigerum]|uniref:Uncharacterized protein n=1 Tax=Gnathostoma spinigerum TaxID=75299 RepID=A0ABD6ESN5_9BILA